MKTAAVFGAGGFIGHHLVKRLKDDGFIVHGYDLKHPEFEETSADEFFIFDLRQQFYNLKYDHVYQLAADMGGAGFIFTGEHDADIMHNSAQINLNVCDALKGTKTKVFYSSSACAYPAYNQEDPDNPNCKEDSIYPAAPDSEYGWEKLFSERLYMSYARNYGLDIRIARFHNIFGEYSCYNNGKEKYPAAICRKVAEAKSYQGVTIWGDGKATRSFLYIDECIDGIMRLMASNYKEPVNIGSDEIISVEDLARMVIDISGKRLSIDHDMNKPQGVRGRNSDNTLIKELLGWSPSQKLEVGMRRLYSWVEKQITKW
jgi:nucleoside-diphosphate-sugar epimerase